MRISAFAVLLLSFPVSAICNERELSLRIGLAHSSVDGRLSTDYPLPTDRFDFSDAGVKLVFDARLTERLGFEFGWADFGSARVGILETQHASAAWVALNRRLTSGPWSFSGKVGAARATLDLRYSPLEFMGEKNMSTELFAGASAAYHFTDRHAAQLSLEQFGDVATVVGLEYAYHWRTDDPAPPPGFGLEIIAGFASMDGIIDGFRFAADTTTDVIVSHVESPVSIPALGLRVPYFSWLSFEFVYFPTRSIEYFAGGIWDPPRDDWTPGMPGPPPPPGPTFTATTEQKAMQIAARFERALAREFDLFLSVGVLHVRESVALRDHSSARVYHRENESSTRPWLGVGMHYRLYKSLSLMVEHGTAGDGGRSRAMLGWSF